MPTTPSSQRARRASFRARLRAVVAVCALAMMCGAAPMFESDEASAGEPVQLARFSEESLPAEDMPSVVATPIATPSGDWEEEPASTPSGPAPAAPPANAAQAPPTVESSPMPAPTSAAQLEPTPIATPTDVAPLEVGSVAPQGQVSDAPLDALIQSIGATQPALAASLRIADQAREEILKHQDDDAIQNLTRAISIEATNPYAYFYRFGPRVILGKRTMRRRSPSLTALKPISGPIRNGSGRRSRSRASPTSKRARLQPPAPTIRRRWLRSPVT